LQQPATDANFDAATARFWALYDALRPNLLSGGAGDDAFVVYHDQFARVDVGTGSNIVVIELPADGPVGAPADPLATTQIFGFDAVLDALRFVKAGSGPLPAVSAEVVTASPGDAYGFAAGGQYTLVRLDGAPAAVLQGAYAGIAAEITVSADVDARASLGIPALRREDFLVA
jgi:hypothetical protein